MKDKKLEAIDCEQTLEISKNYGLSINCSQFYDIKILGFRLCDEQLKFARPYIRINYLKT